MPDIMHEALKASLTAAVDNKLSQQEPRTPQARAESSHVLSVLSPIPRHRLSPAIDEFSLRRTPSRGATASPAPAKGVRKRLHQYRNLDHAVDLLRQSRNIVVLTGAGISTSVGIPDFRSDKGLYSQLSKDLGITEAEEFFSKDYFIQHTDQFFQYVRRVIPEAVVGLDGFFKSTDPEKTKRDDKVPVPKFSLTHAFLALLHSRRKLLTNYTQNIDGLETAAGVPQTKFVQCHGSWDTASCMTCGRSSAARKYLPVVLAGNIPYCKCKLEAEKKSKSRQKKKTGKKRAWSDFDSDHSSDDGTQAPRGLMKPDITFFNERLSSSYGDRLDEDKRKIDLLIIIGTSLKVGPVQDMLYQISPKIPQIFISKERFSGALCNLPGVQVDIELLGECDIIIKELCRRAGWLEQLNSLCWEKGQMRIKEPSVTDQVSTPARQPDNNVSSDPMSDSHSMNRHAKKSKVQHGQSDPEEVKLNGQAENTIASIEDTNIKRTETCEDDVAKTQEEELTAKKVAVPRLSMDQFGVIVQGRVLDIDKGQSEKSDIDLSGVYAMKGLDCPIKVELVEGTAHQWRISKK